MNGFALMADSYRKLLDNPNPEQKAEAERHIRMYDFLATCNQDDFYTLFDSSAFNDIAKDYFRLALKQAGVDDDTRSDVMNELRFLLSEKSAKQVCERSD